MKKHFLFWCIFGFSSFKSMGATAPDFNITLTNGQVKHLYQDYLNLGKTVVIKLFFVDCPPCRTHAPFYQTLYKSWGEGNGPVEFFHLSTSSFDTNNTILQYDSPRGYSFKAAGSDGGSLEAILPYRNGTFGPFQGTPTYIVISPNRELVYDIRGNSVDETMQLLDQAIKNTGAIKPSINVTFKGKISRPDGLPNNTTGQEIRLIKNNVEVSIIYGNSYEFTVPYSSDTYQIKPINNQASPRDGVSTADVISVTRQVLGQGNLNSPFQILAADVNNSKSLSVADLVELRKLILYKIDHFSGSNALRFIATKGFNSTVQDIFAANLLETYTVQANASQSDLDFTFVKIGDVTGNY